MTAPDPRPGGCLHGPGARLGVCPNCGTVVDSDELARVTGTVDALTEAEREALFRAVSHAVNCEGIDARCEQPDDDVASRLMLARPGLDGIGIPQAVERIVAARVAAARAKGREACICNTGPGTDGPDECCPEHGRAYSDWIERGDVLQARAEAAERRLAEVEGKVRAVESLRSRLGRLPVTATRNVKSLCEALDSALSDAPEAENRTALVPICQRCSQPVETLAGHYPYCPAPVPDAPVPQRDGDVDAEALCKCGHKAWIDHGGVMAPPSGCDECFCTLNEKQAAAGVEPVYSNRREAVRGESS